MDLDATVRPARPDDADAVAAFTRDTWSDREATDYLPRVFPEWVASDGDGQRTFVVDVAGQSGADGIAAVGQAVVLSEREAWGQGLRTNPTYRGQGASRALTEGLFDWARDRGATVMRNMVFSWNAAGMGQSRASGYDPATEFRWVHPDPGFDADRGPSDPGIAVTDDPDVAWGYWTASRARDHLRGLALATDESWALCELTPETLRWAADETALFAVESPDGARGMAFRTRTYDREEDGETETWAEYGVGAWADRPAANALLGAIAADAAGIGADRTRVLVPETPRAVSDAASLRAGVADEPDFVFAADLTADHR